MKKENEGVQLLFADTNTLNRFPAQALKTYSEAWGGAVMAYEGLGLMSIYGGIGNALFDSWFSTYSMIKMQAEKLMNDDEIKGVVLCINSPGGMAQGLMEACNAISQLAETKPVYAFIDGEACSAAYALATACDRIYISEGSDTGCCGCYAAAMEYSDQAYKDAGILRKIFRSRNAPKKNLSVITDKEASEHFQSMIDENGDQYLELCASNRGVDKETAEKTFGQGEVVSAKYALDNDMVDEIAGLDKCVADLMAVVNDTDGNDIVPNTETNTEATNLAGSQTSESEGEDMTLIEKFNSVSAEEQKAFLEALSPSHFAERDEGTRKAERDRLHGLEALRNGSAEVDGIVDAAIEDGRCAGDIALDVVKAMKDAPKRTEADDKKSAEKVLETLAESDQEVSVDMTASDDKEAVEAWIARANESRR